MNKQNLYYLASPYSAKGELKHVIEDARFSDVCEAAASLKRMGLLVFSPIAHSHPIAGFGLPGDFAWWKSYDERMLDACDIMVVLMLEGWRESTGISGEVEYAKNSGKKVAYISMNDALYGMSDIDIIMNPKGE